MPTCSSLCGLLRGSGRWRICSQLTRTQNDNLRNDLLKPNASSRMVETANEVSLPRPYAIVRLCTFGWVTFTAINLIAYLFGCCVQVSHAFFYSQGTLSGVIDRVQANIVFQIFFTFGLIINLIISVATDRSLLRSSLRRRIPPGAKNTPSTVWIERNYLGRRSRSPCGTFPTLRNTNASVNRYKLSIYKIENCSKTKLHDSWVSRQVQ